MSAKEISDLDPLCVSGDFRSRGCRQVLLIGVMPTELSDLHCRFPSPDGERVMRSAGLT